MLAAIIRRELRLSLRRGGGAAAGAQFFALTYLVFAFALGPQALASSAPGVLAACLLLSVTLSLPQLYERDAQDGTLEQYRLLLPGEWVAAAKIIAYWCAHALPLAVLSPVAAWFSGADGEAVSFLLRLLPGSVSLVAVGAIGAALTLYRRQGGMTRAIILFPLQVPALIFLAAPGAEALPPLLLCAWALLTLPVACAAGALMFRE